MSADGPVILTPNIAAVLASYLRQSLSGVQGRELSECAMFGVPALTIIGAVEAIASGQVGCLPKCGYCIRGRSFLRQCEKCHGTGWRVVDPS